MRRRLQFRKNHHRPVRFLLVFAAALVLALSGFSALSQDTMPPPPPADVTSDSLTTPPADQNSVRAVRLSDVEGQVQVFQGDQLAFDQAQPNMPAVEGMRFVTGDNGRLEIEFEDGSVARVTPDSSIRLTQLRRNADGSTVTQIEALTGLSYYELNGRGGQYSVRFASAVIAAPVDSAVFRVTLDSIPNELAVMHGSVHVDAGQGLSLDLHPNQTYQTDPEQPGEFTVAQNITASSWDQWNSDRDNALAELEMNQTTARASSGNPDDPAWNDLDYYGSWYNLPGYGQVWSPSGVGAGWDPFGNGYWGYYPSFGYTWISSYPWGWWPYHCGAWDFVGSWGWLWVPGNCGWGLSGAGWYPYATVWRVPPGYTPPRRPRHGPGPFPRPQPLIAVNRGPQFRTPFHFVPGSRPEPRALNFNGTTITPLQASMHPQQRGPLGPSYTTTLVRVHPEFTSPAMRAPGAPGFQGRYTGVRPLPPPSVNAPRMGTAPPNRGAPPVVNHPPVGASGVRISPGAGHVPAPSGGHPAGGAAGGGVPQHR